jgi:hypothetical protein
MQYNTILSITFAEVSIKVFGLFFLIGAFVFLYILENSPLSDVLFADFFLFPFLLSWQHL